MKKTQSLQWQVHRLERMVESETEQPFIQKGIHSSIYPLRKYLVSNSSKFPQSHFSPKLLGWKILQGNFRKQTLGRRALEKTTYGRGGKGCGEKRSQVQINTRLVNLMRDAGARGSLPGLFQIGAR